MEEMKSFEEQLAELDHVLLIVPKEAVCHCTKHSFTIDLGKREDAKKLLDNIMSAPSLVDRLKWREEEE